MDLFSDVPPLAPPAISITTNQRSTSSFAPHDKGHMLGSSLFLAASTSSNAETISGESFKKILDNPNLRSKYYIIDVRNPEEKKYLFLEGEVLS